MKLEIWKSLFFQNRLIIFIKKTGSTIASGSREAKEIKIWSIDKCECENTIKLKTDAINCLKINVKTFFFC